MQPSLKAVIMFTLGCLVAACVSAPSSVTKIDQLTIGDVLKIDVIPGSFQTEDCGIDVSSMGNTDYACVAFPLSRTGHNWDRKYDEALKVDGWISTGGEGNAYSLEKPASSICNHSLKVIGTVQGSLDQAKAYFETGAKGEIENQVFIFALNPKQLCGDRRRSQPKQIFTPKGAIKESMAASERDNDAGCLPLTVKMDVKNSGEDTRNNLFLNSENNYRLRDSLNIRIRKSLAKSILKSRGDTADNFYKDKCIVVSGDVCQVPIAFLEPGTARPTGYGYKQTQMNVKSQRSIELCEGTEG
jgi:hypothetical protein